ncbi:synaptic vesicle VAT-1 family membrane protein [Xanthocytophaga flava]|uniref:synaptic vesicle VAT-1 family membrane protein n=1 Tax=Xanthocytophaga flava TaxID=3048013 RepID=UPI0028D4DA67|nr:medium chain dehydrogenase/reductase family protein [Xanthocytophaga flavus]MDJ1472398.1 medium chain dehydrogenase/reductase family protein [Xanthocytophaga flavus]
MLTRRAFVVPKAGSLKNLYIQEQTLPLPDSDQVTIAVKAIGLNYADIFAIKGLYSATPKGAFVPGLEYAGEVVQVGSKVTHLKVGDKIMGVTRFGSYTTHLNIDARYVMPLPEGWTFAEGAAFPVQVLTAYYALVPLGALKNGQTVLIHSAAGGVGILANRIAKRLGAYTIGVVGNASKLELLHKEGYDGAVIRSTQFKNDVQKALQGRELNIVLETTGSKYFYWSYELLASQGRLIAYGSAQFTTQGNRPNYFKLVCRYLFRPRLSPLKMIPQNKSLMAFNLIWIYEKAKLMQELWAEINVLKLPPPLIGHTFSFEQLPQALQLFQTGKTVGKIIVEVS